MGVIAALSHGIFVDEVCDYPVASDVRFGVTYGGGVGTLVCGDVALTDAPEHYSPADILATVLVALGLGSQPSSGQAWPVYVGSTPQEPDRAITTFDTSSRDDGRLMFSGEKVSHFGVQVRVRADVHATGYSKARQLAKAVDEDVYDMAVTVGPTTYRVHTVTRLDDPTALGKDVPSGKRSVFTFNVTVSLRCEHLP